MPLSLGSPLIPPYYCIRNTHTAYFLMGFPLFLQRILLIPRGILAYTPPSPPTSPSESYLLQTGYRLLSHGIPASFPRDPAYTSWDSCLYPPLPIPFRILLIAYWIVDTSFFLMGFPLLLQGIPLIYHGFPLRLFTPESCLFAVVPDYFPWNPDYSSRDSCLIFSGSCSFLTRFLLIPHGSPIYSPLDTPYLSKDPAYSSRDFSSFLTGILLITVGFIPDALLIPVSLTTEFMQESYSLIYLFLLLIHVYTGFF
jgi:hypothetical protein